MPVLYIAGVEVELDDEVAADLIARVREVKTERDRLIEVSGPDGMPETYTYIPSTAAFHLDLEA